MKRKRWTINDDMYLLHWAVSGNIGVFNMAIDLGRDEKTTAARIAFLKSPKGAERVEGIKALHMQLKDIAKRMVAIEGELAAIRKKGFNTDDWLENVTAMNDFNEARYPELYGEA